ncbi:MAG TPA: type II toxin-antitoxin system VapC family toxin [Terriglobales bacterium]|nr:type II toxin-antitoxin system VapC family toxin [Terriglobales bacterium]
MIILDTNVLSALMHQSPDKTVIAWLDRQPRTSVWTTSVTLFEVRYGLQILADGRRRSALLDAFELVFDRIGQRIVSFDASAALHAGELMAIRKTKGRPVDMRDTMIAGIALAQHATLATRNTLHFEDTAIPLVNPWSP